MRFSEQAGQSRRRFVASVMGGAFLARAAGAWNSGAADSSRYRVIVSTDIGGTDPDDFQSMVHFLVYADALDIEGLVSSPAVIGTTKNILEVVDKYELDYPKLKTYSARYPTPDALRAITKQGAMHFKDTRGYAGPTEGSRWIIECARRDDPRPLYVLAWGMINDVAQALHDAPDIKDRLRVYFIAGPNKKWSLHAYNYIEENHPDAWFIENNSTYRGWFVGGDQSGDLGNQSFVSAHVKGCGALGDYFAGFLNGTIKMGDTPSVAYMLNGDPANPTGESWGGRYVRAWKRPKVVYSQPTTASDTIEVFGIVELALPVRTKTEGKTASLVVDGQEFPATFEKEGSCRFRFMPKDTGLWSYRVKSDIPEINGFHGEFRSVQIPPDSAKYPSARFPRWWTDDPDPSLSDGKRLGIKTVSRWREAYLRDWQKRMQRCVRPA